MIAELTDDLKESTERVDRLNTQLLDTKTTLTGTEASFRASDVESQELLGKIEVLNRLAKTMPIATILSSCMPLSSPLSHRRQVLHE